ncbi:MAG: hypothetical protein CMJ34_14455 [Phycisphaerae bacterium]|nr:hypothetical protein [Phycisphaerae bacterium]
MRRTIPLPSMILSSITPAVAFAAAAETITVCDRGCDHVTIQDAIDAADEEGDVIEIGPGVWRENLATNKQLILRGAGPDLTIIDGSDGPIGWSPCLMVSEDFDGWRTRERFRVESMTLRGGSGAEIFGLVRGGGVYIEFVPVTFSNVVIEDCEVRSLGEFTVEGIGGAICNYFGDVMVESSVLRNNSAFTLGGAIFSTHGPLRIVDTVIEGNIGEVDGGAILADESPMSIERSTICGNSSDQIVGEYVDLGGNIISPECGAPSCPTDLDRSGTTDGADLGDVFTQWGDCDDCPADFDRDGTVDAGDLGLLIAAWGPCS